jgi:glycosyltransferase involved in cell wall biosynthesis
MVSVIIPCYNSGLFVDRAIGSVISQKFKDFEIILVDNNSTDNTFELLKRYESSYPDFIQAHQELKKGAPAARNHGMRHAKGEWIQFLDADDELLPDKLAHQLEIARLLKADVVAGECLLKYDDGKTKIVRHTDSDIWRGLINSNLGITSSNLWRAEAVSAVNGWDEKMTSSQEYDLLFRLLRNKAIIVADKTIHTIVHFSKNSVSKSSDNEKLKQILNNRINLRLQIKNELRYRALLTPTLKAAIDLYIYTEIMSNYHRFPDYVNSLLQRHQLQVSLLLKLKLKTRQYLQLLK